jgi:hypothetical protein
VRAVAEEGIELSDVGVAQEHVAFHAEAKLVYLFYLIFNDFL